MIEETRASTERQAAATSGVSVARWIHIVLGIWLFFSSFMWTHSTAQFVNGWLAGIAAATFAATKMRANEARYIHAGLALWLLLSLWVLPTRSDATVWNHVVVAAVMLLVALLPQTRQGRPVEPQS